MRKIVLFLLFIPFLACQEDVVNIDLAEESLYTLWQQFKETENPDTEVKVIGNLLEKATQLENDEYIGKALYAKGKFAKDKGDHEGALRNYINADKHFQAAGKPLSHANIMANIGGIMLINRNYESAIEYYVEAVNIYEDFNKHKLSIKVYTNLGLCHTYKINPDYKQAENIYEKALNIIPSLTAKQTYYYNRVHNLIGAMHYEASQYEKAISHYLKSMEYAKGDEAKEAIAKNNIGEAYLGMKDLDIAEQWISDALQTAGNGEAKATCMITQGQLFMERNNHEKAVLSWHKAIELSEEGTGVLSNEELNRALSLANTSLARLKNKANNVPQEVIIDIVGKAHDVYENKEVVLKQLSSEHARNILDKEVHANKLESTIGQLQKELADTVGDKTSYFVLLCMMVLATVGLYVIFRRATNKYTSIKGKYQRSQAFDVELLNRIKASGFLDNFKEVDQ